MHVSDHSRVASLLFFYRVIRSGFMLLIAVEQRFCKFALFCAVHLNLRPSRHHCSDGVLVNAHRKSGFLCTRPNEIANLGNGFADTQTRMLKYALND